MLPAYRGTGGAGMAGGSRMALVLAFLAVGAAAVAALSTVYSAGGRSGAHCQPQIGVIDFNEIIKESQIGKAISTQAVPKEQAIDIESQAQLKEFQGRDE